MDENNKRRKNKTIKTKNNKSKRAWEMVMSNFTDDLWTLILLLLPFKREYLEPECEDDGRFSLYHLDSGRILEDVRYPYSQGEYPLELDDSYVVGSDCGIVGVCVSVSGSAADKYSHDLYLWNPATKQSKRIPPCIRPENNRYGGDVGFGFDHIDLDFKVVRVTVGTLSAEVYSSNRNNWRRIELELNNFFGRVKFHLCFHGFLFAVAYSRDRGSTGMVAFDLNKEVFICDINLPISSFDDDEKSSRITEFKDTVAAITYFCMKGSDKINLWTLDGEACLCGGGVKASWTKVLSIDVGVPLLYVEALFNNVQFLLNDEYCNRLLYNSINKTTTDVPGCYDFPTGGFWKYTKSLFTLAGFKRVEWTASSTGRSQDSSSDSDGEMDE